MLSIYISYIQFISSIVIGVQSSVSSLHDAPVVTVEVSVEGDQPASQMLQIYPDETL